MSIHVLSEQEMLEQVTQDIRALRSRVDRHIDDQVDRLVKISDNIAKIQVDMADHRGRIETRVAMIAGGISVLCGGAVAWVVKHMGGP